MAIDFPTSPTPGVTTYEYLGVKYTYTAEEYWAVLTPGSVGSASAQEVKNGTDVIKYITPSALVESGLLGGGGGEDKNFLHNPDFFIWQREKSILLGSTASDTMIADRWYALGGGSTTIQCGQVLNDNFTKFSDVGSPSHIRVDIGVSGSENQEMGIAQIVEGGYELANAKVAFRFRVKPPVGATEVKVGCGTSAFPLYRPFITVPVVEDVWQTVSGSFNTNAPGDFSPKDNTTFNIFLAGEVGGEVMPMQDGAWLITDVQLGLGEDLPVWTPPDYGAQYAICANYYKRLFFPDGAIVATGSVSNGVGRAILTTTQNHKLLQRGVSDEFMLEVSSIGSFRTLDTATGVNVGSVTTTKQRQTVFSSRFVSDSILMHLANHGAANGDSLTFVAEGNMDVGISYDLRTNSTSPAEPGWTDSQ